MTVARPGRRALPLWRKAPGDAALVGILSADFFGAIGATMVHLTMVWWVLEQGVSAFVVSLMVLSIYAPLNVGVLLSGLAVARWGARRLLIRSKAVAVVGAAACAAMLGSGAISLGLLACVAIVTYGALGPSLAADLSRTPALTRLAGRRLASFNAANGASLVIGQVIGLVLAGRIAGSVSPAAAAAFGTAFAAVGLGFTWASFPRDRLRAGVLPGPALAEARGLIRRALAELRRAGPAVAVLWATLAIIAASEMVSEVHLPLSLRAFGLPPSALAVALIAAVIASVLAGIAAQAVHGRLPLPRVLLVTAVLVAASGVAALALGAWAALVLHVAVLVGAANGIATLVLTDIQEAMPVSLQAQSIGLWQSVVLTAGTLSILAAGLAGPLTLLLAFGLILGATGAGLLAFGRARPAQ